MDNNCYRVNIIKWLPFPNKELNSWFQNAMELNNITNEQARNIALIVEQIQNCVDICDTEIIDALTDGLTTIINSYKTIQSKQANCQSMQMIYKYKMEYLLSNLTVSLNVLVMFTYNLINEVVDYENDEFVRKIFRLINVYNDAIKLKWNVSEPSINIFVNDCPSMLESLKTMSAMRILQVLAKKGAEKQCHELIDCLLTTYRTLSEVKTESPPSQDIEVSENSSVEIYRALTKHMTPPHRAKASNKTHGRERFDSSHVENINILVNNQTEQIKKLILLVSDISPELFGRESFKVDSRGESRIRQSALTKIIDYYQGIAWATISGILDHVVLWWSSEGIAARHNHGAHQLKDWLHQFVQSSNDVPTSVRPALLNLCDTLGCHVTTTCWDELFREAYISAIASASRPSSTEGTETGQMFSELFQLLVTLSNECEMGGEWVIGAPLIELPISEQIIVLHRLDHSIHTMRLWAIEESRLIAHTWELESFFLLVKGDLINCINELSYLKLADHTIDLSINVASVHVYVCAKMRAKIVSEVKANITLLKESSCKCINTLAKICRVVSLANLHMCFPISNRWRRTSTVTNITASPYVEIYLDRVLLPVLEVIDDHEISNMVLKIMCEAWLDYIYLHRIKFSELGAHQLLTDFAYVSQWVRECSIVSQNIKEHLLKNEVLRRCEGVGRLLLRHPGESISMQKRIPTRTSENGSPESLGLERMPAEMYVPNQEQWLELRAGKYYKLYCCVE